VPSVVDCSFLEPNDYSRFELFLLTSANYHQICIICLGEFTLRAFLNGRLDLAQAENVSRLILAKSAAAADSALAGIQVFQRLISLAPILSCLQSLYRCIEKLMKYAQAFHSWV
jgi:tRNA U34 5-carboxymethylaminomethyl modifying GTPase MnmE/TrmE